ncbi:CUB and sushi domain-containing protein 3-like [Amphiura filiformis]|uniref:CUB and sushi domain-containing protein 3-like n=1 Tax=Amphiura filiformis TaxID=82378 RepID=UPI003B2136D4
MYLIFNTDFCGLQHINIIPCREEEFLCLSGYGCFDDKSILCDNIKQCVYGSDEENCDLCGPSSEFVLQKDEIINFTSPNYPLVFPSDAECLWLISSTSENIDIFIQFVIFQIRQGFSWLNIGIGDEKDVNTILELSGSILRAPSSIIGTSTLWINFNGHDFITDDEVGFWLDMRGVEANYTCNLDEFACDQTFATICLHGYQKCDGIPMCPGEIDEQNCGECGVRNIYLRTDDFMTNLTSPGYPFGYRDDLICLWTVYGRESRYIVIAILDFQMERGYDFLTIGNGEDSTSRASIVAKLTGDIKLRTISSSRLSMWLQVAADRTGTGKGFNIEISLAKNILAICQEDDFNCGEGFCADESAECDGFNDCLNQADELECASVYCPGSYLCEKAENVKLRSCVLMQQVCDGNVDCPAGDDEIECENIARS